MRARGISHTRFAMLIWFLAPLAACAPAFGGLEASGPDPRLRNELALFGQFVGDWTFDVIYHRDDGTTLEATGEWRFAWILGGRAIQDIWIVPAPRRLPAGRAQPIGYGTTVRVYDAGLKAWHVTWHGVLNGAVYRFLARREGDEIVMQGQQPGEHSRWVFHDITPNAFRWRALGSDDGRTWRVEQEMSVRRRRP